MCTHRYFTSRFPHLIMACWVFAVRHLAPEEAQLSTTYFPHGAACYQHFVATFAKQHPGRPSPRAPTPAPPLPVPLPGVRLPTTSSLLPALSYSVAATDLGSATDATPPPGAEDQLEGGHARDPGIALACTTSKLGSVVQVTPDLEGSTGSEVGVGGVYGVGSNQGHEDVQRIGPGSLRGVAVGEEDTEDVAATLHVEQQHSGTGVAGPTGTPTVSRSAPANWAPAPSS